MKKVLFIEYFFPPLTPHWRSVAFTKYLPEFGWEPVVLSAAETVSYSKDYHMLEEIPEGSRVFRVAHREPPRWWQYLRHTLKIAADFPDYYKTWYSPAYKRAANILRRERFDLIYSASPTFTTALVAERLRKRFGVPWVADFHDGWAVNDFLDRNLDETLVQPLRWLHKWRIRKAEKQILKLADRVVVVHPHVRERWCQLHRIDRAKIEVITEGYDETVFRGLRARALYDDRITITFLGNYYDFFGEYIARFSRLVHQIDAKAELVFIGRGAASVQRLNLPNSTCMMHIPMRRAIEFGMGSNFLFLVMPPFAKWTPSKTYDYLRIGKPILALVPPDGDAARIVRECKAGCVLDFDETQMKTQLSAIFRRLSEKRLAAFRSERKYVTRFERRELTQQMARIFDETVHE